MTADSVNAELVAQRARGLADLEAELDSRRAELTTLVERERAKAFERIAAEERLEHEAIARRREALEHGSEDAAATLDRLVSERIDVAIAAERSMLDERRAEAEARVRDEIEARRRAELAQLEAWRVSERERIVAELAAEEQRFNERLLHQLQEFEYQLGERLRESEERFARHGANAEELVRARMATAFEDEFVAPPERASPQG